ncbi:hypothetical protein [Rubellimicrobium mesophilum]|uniref:hypothetical protein n=1 Tax=Rubellimicrobium mesophilum TaxID=1123067 RepID=UPI001FE0F8AF|nr:hypothetical protein [Rubellimicrobium mesophilum]
MVADVGGDVEPEAAVVVAADLGADANGEEEHFEGKEADDEATGGQKGPKAVLKEEIKHWWIRKVRKAKG